MAPQHLGLQIHIWQQCSVRSSLDKGLLATCQSAVCYKTKLYGTMMAWLITVTRAIERFPGVSGAIRLSGSGRRMLILRSAAKVCTVCLNPALPCAGRLNRQQTHVQRSSTERAQHAPPMRAMSMPQGQRNVGGWHREGVSDEAASRLADHSIPEDGPAGVASLVAVCTALCNLLLHRLWLFQHSQPKMHLTHAKQQISNDDTAILSSAFQCAHPASLPEQAAP